MKTPNLLFVNYRDSPLSISLLLCCEKYDHKLCREITSSYLRSLPRSSPFSFSKSTVRSCPRTDLYSASSAVSAATFAFNSLIIFKSRHSDHEKVLKLQGFRDFFFFCFRSENRLFFNSFLTLSFELSIGKKAAHFVRYGLLPSYI